MLGFFGRILSGFMTVTAILILILGFVLGCFIVDNTNYRASNGEIFFGGVGGLVGAFVFDVMTYGVIGIFIEMRDTQSVIKKELKEIKEMMQKAEKTERTASSASIYSANVANSAPVRHVNVSNIPASRFVTCPKCREENPGTSYICYKCGASLR